MAKATTKLTIALTGPLRKRLVAAAANHGVTMSEECRRILAEALGLPVPVLKIGNPDMSRAKTKRALAKKASDARWKGDD